MTALDLFAGPGGWSEACTALGVDELGVEIDPDACATARLAGHARVQWDVRRWTPDLPDAFDGLIASPPCQTFSRAGGGTGVRDLDRILAAVPQVAAGVPIDDALGPDDHTATWESDDALFELPGVLDRRTALVLEPLRFVRMIRPTWVALEQVPDVLPIWQAYGAALLGLGYHVRTGILRAECYGVPQTRRRAILVAHRTREVSLPRPTHSAYHGNVWDLDPGVEPWISMAAALGWSDDALVGFPRRDDGEATIDLDGVAYRERDLRMAAAPAQTVTEKSWSWVVVNDQSGTERDPDWPTKRPATTIAGRDLVPDPGPNANRFNTSTKSRNDGVRVGVSDAGVLQGFRPDYPWQGSKTSRHRQIGDAIPPPMALAILREVV
jgi:DNA (cytosine-5)-methyltransferase 1